MVEPNQYDFLSNQLKNHEIKFDIVIDDIGSIIKPQRIVAQNRTLQQGKISFDAYYSHKEVSFIYLHRFVKIPLSIKIQCLIPWKAL